MHFLRTLLLAPVAVMARPWSVSPAMVARTPQDEAAPPAEEQPAAGKVIPVVGGGQQDVFVPNVVQAAVGDTVQFQFSAGNHTATQSTADAACVPMEGGVHSGHIPFEDGQTTVGTFDMEVTSTDTMFIYCATGPHCQLGQVLVINPTDDQQVIDYANNAQQAPENIDADEVIGGTVGEIPLEEAVFVAPPPAEEEAGGGAGGAAPPTEGAPAVSYSQLRLLKHIILYPTGQLLTISSIG